MLTKSSSFFRGLVISTSASVQINHSKSFQCLRKASIRIADFWLKFMFDLKHSWRGTGDTERDRERGKRTGRGKHTNAVYVSVSVPSV